MEEIYLKGIKLDEFFERIIEALRQELDKSNKAPITSPPAQKYLSRQEVCELLKISLPTLHSYTKHGLIQSKKIGNRVLYPFESIEEALSKASIIKYKKHKL